MPDPATQATPPSEDPAAASLTAAPAPRAAESQRAPPDPADAAARVANGPPESSAWVARGRVWRAEGEPLPHAKVSVETFVGLHAEGEPSAHAEVECDGEGAFAFARPAPERSLVLRFCGASPDHGKWPVVVRVAAGDPAPQGIEVYAYPLDVAITGRVTDAEGRPVAGAWVRTGRDRVACGDDGSYRVLATSSFATWTVEAGAPGHARDRRTLVPTPGSERRADFALRSGRRLVGRVEDVDRRPVEGAEVMTWGTLRDPVRSDRDGRFALFVDPQLRTDTLFARAADFVLARQAIDLDVLDPAAEVVVVLRRGTRLSGRVFAPNGRPLAGAEVEVGETRASFELLQAVSGDDGAFAIAAVPPGSQRLTVHRRGFAPQQRALDVPSDRELVLDIELPAAR
jgi:hypothetical protein